MESDLVVNVEVGILILNLRRRYVYLFIVSLHFKGSMMTKKKTKVAYMTFRLSPHGIYS